MSNTLASEYPDEADDDIIYEVKEGDQGIVHFDPVVPGVMQSNPVMAKMALMLSSQGWNILGHGNDPNIAASNDMTITVERITSLFLIRIVALVSHRNSLLPSPATYIPKFSDLSATTICKEALERKKPWPKPITMHIIQQLRGFIRNILEKYNAVHYHSFEHAYHVTISVHKLTELMLANSHSEMDIKIAEEVRRTYLSSNKSTSERRLNVNPTKLLPRKTFGLKSDPLMILSLLFSALVHDVEHRGVPNRQLVLESHELAILYNDQSVAEQRSLAVAFSELMKPDFKELRDVIFEGTDEYHRFRKAVINTVLATDVASPERTQLVKSKWKEAFGDPSETVERKKNKELSRRNIFSIVREKPGSNRTSTSLPVNWKGRQDSKPRQIYGANNARPGRRGSQGTSAASSKSMMSDLTIDPSLRFLARGNCETSKEALSYIHDNESDEESKSATPESSDGQESFDEMESRQIDNKTFLTNTDPIIAKSLARKPSLDPKSKKQDSLSRHSETGSFLKTDAFGDQNINDSNSVGTRSRRHTLSQTSHHSDFDRGYSIRLSIRRSLDLTGEAIENYSQSSRNLHSNFRQDDTKLSSHECEQIYFDPDDTDELKASVVMEHLIRAADVGALMQGWDQMVKWSNRLFFELKATHDQNRGEDPQTNWFENQITFLESYSMPLARRLNDLGMFGESIGSMFELIVKQNRDQWIEEGRAATAHIVQEWQISRGKRLILDPSW